MAGRHEYVLPPKTSSNRATAWDPRRAAEDIAVSVLTSRLVRRRGTAADAPPAAAPFRRWCFSVAHPHQSADFPVRVIDRMHVDVGVAAFEDC
jgi:hypothetical protein